MKRATTMRTGPSELYLIAAVHLGRLTSIVIPSLPELHNGVEQQGENDQKNGSCHREYK
jgi:hypothetical protein